ncbi:GNAT family N-acetyltransferase [Liquorilactobacillus sicerae]|uniref:GNAT family N-acetyltransferase n=1 Tax=Liquorilactobacillus sicerae TaxID=1416943 RepID=UPI002480F938|nr:GNAT family N-acetyltransferase [Liquorilactobacillus sicerae]
MNFEKLTVKDSWQLTQLLHDAYQADEDLGIHFKAADIGESIVKKHLVSTPTFGYKGNEDRLISTVSVRLPWSINPGPYSLPHIGWVATDSKHKHQGLARKIILDVINKFIKEELMAPGVTLGTAVEHPWLKDFYISLGFTPFEEIRKYQDHKTVYLIKLFDEDDLRKISDEKLRTILQKAKVFKEDNDEF